jgi:hypothetical protein
MAFLHGYQGMHLAAEGIDTSGVPFAFGRHKGIGNTLVDAAGNNGTANTGGGGGGGCGLFPGGNGAPGSEWDISYGSGGGGGGAGGYGSTNANGGNGGSYGGGGGAGAAGGSGWGNGGPGANGIIVVTFHP